MARTASSPILQLIRRIRGDLRGDDFPDQELLRRFLGERDEAAFETLLRRHGPMVLDVCRGVLGNEADAEDAFQATFLVLAHKTDSIRKAASLASFLHGVAYRTALKARDNSARRQRHEARAPQRSTTTDPDELSWREVRQAVHEELDRLPERLRAALVLCYLEGKTQDEAAAQLGWAKGTLKGRLERGRALLRARLVRRGLGSGAALALGAWPATTATARLSPPLLLATVQATTASVVSPHVAALAKSMVKAMFFKKLKIAALLLLALAGSGTGLALTMRELPRPEATRVGGLPVPQEEAKLAVNARDNRGTDSGRPIRSLSGHKERVTSVAYSPDGRWIATAAWDGTARLWDARTGEELRRLDVPDTQDHHPAQISHVLFSPDNAFLVTAQQAMPNEDGVIVWNCRSGEKVRAFKGDYVAAIAPDGKYIACGGWGRSELNQCAIRLYEFASGKLLRQIHTRYSRIHSLNFAPDGQMLFAQVGIPRPPLGNGMERLGMDPIEIRAWDVATAKERKTCLEGAGAALQGNLFFSPDGRTLALGGSLWETATGRHRAELKLTGYAREVCEIVFSADGRTLASAHMDGMVRLWDRLSGKEIGHFGKEVERFKGGWVLAVASSPDGRTLVSGGLDKTAHLWDVSRITGRRRKSAERSSEDLEADWRDLAGDAATGYAALGRLVSSPERAVEFLGKQLQSAKPPDAKRIERLIANLDDERFQVREQAARELEALAELAEPALRKALAGRPSLEVKRRLETLLDRLIGGSLSAETVRHIRGVETLEAIGNPQVRHLIDKLATGPAEMRLTQEAKASAGRLAKWAVLAP